MAILNVTPDSFSDGGEWFAFDRAVEHARALVDEGADIVDIGGESTRPRADPVGVDEELRRVVPVVHSLRGAGAQISVDTAKLTVAEAAVDAGASFVNDVTAFRQEPELAGFVADRGCDCCLMHMLGDPRTMQDDPRYDDVVDDVRAFLEQRAEFAVREGVREERILVDPGIGFGKTLEHNLELLRRLDRIATIGFPVVIGTSRKSFLGRLTGAREPARPRRGDGGDDRARAGARGQRLPRPRRRADEGRPGGGDCYVARRWPLTTTTSSRTSSRTTRTTTTMSARRRRPR